MKLKKAISELRKALDSLTVREISTGNTINDLIDIRHTIDEFVSIIKTKNKSFVIKEAK